MIHDEERRARHEAQIQGDAIPGRRMPPTYGYCTTCGEAIWNKGAHAEACTGQPRLRCEAYTYSVGAFGVRKQCVRPWAHDGGHIY